VCVTIQVVQMSTAIEPIVTESIEAWQLDPAHTNVEFAVKHLMIATVRGRFSDVTGTLKGNLAEPPSSSSRSS